MYRDESIELSPNLPKRLQEDIAELERLYDEDDDFGWLRLMELIDIDTRAYIASGRIITKEGYDVLRRFGWR